MRFASWIFDRNASKIRAVDSFEQMDKLLNGFNLKVEFMAYANKTDGIKCNDDQWKATAPYLVPQLNALIARYSKLGENAFYKYYLPVDDTVQQALERLK